MGHRHTVLSWLLPVTGKPLTPSMSSLVQAGSFPLAIQEMGLLGFQVNENSSYKVTCQLPNDKKAINYKTLYMEKTFNHSTHKSKKFLKVFLTEKHKGILFMSWKLTTI